MRLRNDFDRTLFIGEKKEKNPSTRVLALPTMAQRKTKSRKYFDFVHYDDVSCKNRKCQPFFKCRITPSIESIEPWSDHVFTRRFQHNNIENQSHGNLICSIVSRRCRKWWQHRQRRRRAPSALSSVPNENGIMLMSINRLKIFSNKFCVVECKLKSIFSLSFSFSFRLEFGFEEEIWFLFVFPCSVDDTVVWPRLEWKQIDSQAKMRKISWNENGKRGKSIFAIAEFNGRKHFTRFCVNIRTRRAIAQ